MKRRSFFKTVAGALAALPFVGRTTSADDGLKFIEHTGEDIESSRIGEYVANEKPSVYLPGRREIIFDAHGPNHNWRTGDVIQVKQHDSNPAGYDGRYRFLRQESLTEEGIIGLCRFTFERIGPLSK